ncbi:response regulator transcription factor [Streptomyces rimosus]|uniref:response regulator transcription factor n=1 Tax=Streptomyces rimosus TaxID=1927 RepID=UPI0004CB0113|nr:response regulator transcription factor [Streptomyces rimosus]
MIRVGLADKHPVVLLGLEKALEADAEISVTATSVIPELLNLENVDVVLMEAVSGSDEVCLSSVAALSRSVRVVVYSADGDAMDVQHFIRAGAVAHVPKSSALEGFVKAVIEAASKELQENGGGSKHRGTSLSPRERAVLNLVADGLTHAQIARQLNISTSTVNTYIKRVRAKIKLGNKADLTRAALRLASAPE